MENRLVLIGATTARTKDRHILYEFKCQCGSSVFLPRKVVSSGNTKSCGCLRSEVSASSVLKVQHLAAKATKVSNRKHGMRNTRFWKIHAGMLWRCKDAQNKNYGGRGIKVCDRWHVFENFRDDMYQDYLSHIAEFGETRSGTSIDRIDVNGNYEPNNCKWSTASEQALNKRKACSD